MRSDVLACFQYVKDVLGVFHILRRVGTLRNCWHVGYVAEYVRYVLEIDSPAYQKGLCFLEKEGRVDGGIWRCDG